jgi:hypothetical protein
MGHTDNQDFPPARADYYLLVDSCLALIFMYSRIRNDFTPQTLAPFFSAGTRNRYLITAPCLAISWYKHALGFNVY